MIRLVLTLMAATAVPIAALAQAATPQRPTGPWVVAYENGVCLLQRTYGSADRPLTLSMRQVPTMQQMGLFVLDSAAGKPEADPVEVGFGGGAVVRAPLTVYRTRDGKGRYTETQLDRAEVARAGSSGVLSVAAGSQLSYAFAVPGLQKALAQVDSCIADQLTQWGIAPAELASTARFPRPLDEELVGDGNFLLDSREADAGGQNVAYVRVDSSGKARDCRVAVPSGKPLLDQASCDVLLGERFRPATSRDGRPIDSLFAQSFTWRVTK